MIAWNEDLAKQEDSQLDGYPLLDRSCVGTALLYFVLWDELYVTCVLGLALTALYLPACLHPDFCSTYCCYQLPFTLYLQTSTCSTYTT
jgi:hypothetical protein